ncbi:cytochrome c oxidase assembly protein [Histoplasma capsulatum]|uniref:Cytochrome c oxidase assembly protein n=1 Tax=Ajellomyces capsulatus TaxID=5037 RepID=A0A8A1MQS9_AJECA|nr:cytochrome c oxidase assembly protein COX15 [Histoplasma mississippiense (nom. inval.)]EDN09912.1 cytochrome c oxidase assembly protein COX15 [Histoplasma mississippiense (nom. inval.)]QSS66417.1 cytochrome c oxidase assembly protein [Histoplasma capsulatum]
MAFASPMFRSLAPRVSKEFFTCRQCLRKNSQFGVSSQRWMSVLPFRTTLGPKVTSLTSSVRMPGSSILRFASFTYTAKPAGNGSSAGKSKYPDVSDKVVAYWLLGSAASVFGLVVFGGLTRLTESGLSITEWRPVTGSLPPFSAEDWESEFSKYKSSPEYKILNPNMSLSEFKFIYYMEWIHRQWGRFVGLSFILPAAFFVATKKVSKPMSLRLLGIGGLIGFQGFIGWWMVKSGLKDDLFAPGSHPRVSQYRLTTHLGTAFLCYTAMLWNGLAILRSNRLLKDPVKGMEILNDLRHPKLSIFRKSVAGLALLAFTTVISGGLVAGLDAGLIYNEFPFMGEGFVPPTSELFSAHYSRLADKSDLWWRNMLENPSLVQLNHRILALTTFSSVMSLWAYTSFSPAVKQLLPKAAKKGMHGVVGFTFLQVSLGITTLMYLVPTHLASAHQAGSLFLLTWVLVLGSRIWHPSRTARLLQMAAKMSKGHVPKPVASK